MKSYKFSTGWLLLVKRNKERDGYIYQEPEFLCYHVKNKKDAIEFGKRFKDLDSYLVISCKKQSDCDIKAWNCITTPTPTEFDSLDNNNKRSIGQFLYNKEIMPWHEWPSIELLSHNFR